MAKQTLVPTIVGGALHDGAGPVSEKRETLFLDSGNRGVFWVDGVQFLSTQPLGPERLKAAWQLVTKSLMSRLLRSRKTARESWRQAWRREILQLQDQEAVTAWRNLALWRTQSWLAVACCDPDDTRLWSHWRSGSMHAPEPPPIVWHRFCSLMLELHWLIVHHYPQSEPQYWEGLRGLYPSFPELFCHLVQFAESVLHQKDMNELADRDGEPL